MDLGVRFLGLLTDELLLAPTCPCSALFSQVCLLEDGLNYLPAQVLTTQIYNLAVAGKI